jgi:ABC-type Na+ efflux pump permease subunit
VNKVFRIALREFASTALTRGFIIGAFIVPVVMLGLLIVLMPMLMKDRTPKISGSVAIIDPTGIVVPGIQTRMSPEAIRARQEERAGTIKEAATSSLPDGLVSEQQLEQATKAAAAAAASKMDLTLEILAPDADIEAEKAPLMQGTPQDGGRLAVVTVSPFAITREAPDKAFGGFELFVKPKLDDRVSGEIRTAVRESILEARIQATGQDPAEIRALTQISNPAPISVSKDGETRTSELQIFLPFGFMALIMVSVMVGGQYLLTTTIEEKSNRIVEVLLSAVSPMELMTGKILGQMGVGVALMAMYGALGGGALAVFALLSLVEPMNALYMFIYFILAYFLVASMMAAIGAAVNDLREAQSLMTPVMLVVMLPYLLWLPISRDPNGMFATVLSFLPPISPFVMVLRINSTEPPPMWQIPVSILVNVVGAYIMLRLTAKIFRVGLLMYGKPPNFGTLIRWVRMA